MKRLGEDEVFGIQALRIMLHRINMEVTIVTFVKKTGERRRCFNRSGGCKSSEFSFYPTEASLQSRDSGLSPFIVGSSLQETLLDSDENPKLRIKRPACVLQGQDLRAFHVAMSGDESFLKCINQKRC